MQHVISLGPLTLHPYGLFIGLGLLSALQVIQHITKKEHILSEQKLTILTWLTLLGGIIGARAYHVIDAWNYYAQHPTLIPQVWQGGLGIYGGIIGGSLAILLYAWISQRKSQISGNNQVYASMKTACLWIDVAALGLPLAQAIGRLGNWVNQELYGLPTNLPWGVYIAPEFRLAGFEQFEYFHPIFAYEALWMLLTFGILYGFLYRVKRNKLGMGLYTLVYLLSYASIRFFLDFMRIYPWRAGIFTVAQWISLAIIIVCSTGLIRIKRR